MAFSDFHLFFDDIEVGQEWESLGRTLTETDIVNFAGLSGDFNPIHVDHDYAASTTFRRPIAHGLLIFSIGSGLGMMFPPMRTLAFLSIAEWYFREPVFVGDTLHALARVAAKEERARGRRGVVTWQRQIVNQHKKIVQEGTTLTLVQGRGRGSTETGESPDETT